MNTLKSFFRNLLGYKYYAVLIDDSHRDYLSSNIFSSRKNAQRYAHELKRACRSLHPSGIVSFRTNKPLNQLDDEINK